MEAQGAMTASHGTSKSLKCTKSDMKHLDSSKFRFRCYQSDNGLDEEDMFAKNKIFENINTIEVLHESFLMYNTAFVRKRSFKVTYGFWIVVIQHVNNEFREAKQAKHQNGQG